MADTGDPRPPSITAVATGPGALYLYIGSPASPALSRRLGAWRRVLGRSRPPALARAIYDVVPGYDSLLISFQPGLAHERVAAWALGCLPDEDDASSARTHEVRVAYGRDADATELTERLELPFDEIVARHAAAEYTVAFLGFTAGFPYLLGLPSSLHTPRRSSPRERTPAGAVAIAGDQAGIYPAESPGGWWVLGRTDAVLFDPEREPSALLAPGDAVRFRAVETVDRGDAELGGGPQPARDAGSSGTKPEDSDAGDAPRRDAAAAGGRTVHVMEAWPRTTSLQAGPRLGVGHFGMAESGALDRMAFAAANEILGNDPGAAALEVIGQHVAIRTASDLRAVVTGGGLAGHLHGESVRRWSAFDWPAGATLELVPDRNVTGATSYLAVAGGFAAHAFAGSASTDARAGVGGIRRYVQTGDVLSVPERIQGRSESPRVGTPRYPERVVLRIHRGPQPDAAVWTQLVQSRFTVSVLDRTGARLAGPQLRLPSHETRSEGSPAGAIQVPPDGQPIVLLADRGRTGGYAKPAVIDPRDLWRLAQAGPGTEIWFAPAPEAVSHEPVDWAP